MDPLRGIRIRRRQAETSLEVAKPFRKPQSALFAERALRFLFLYLIEVMGDLKMILFFQTCLVAVTVSSMYTLVALGFTMYVGVINLANFSHGDTCVLASFLMMPLIVPLLGLNLSPAVTFAVVMGVSLVTLLLAGVWGSLFYKMLVRPLLNSPRLILLLATVAAGQVLREVIRVVYPNGSNPQVFPEILPFGGFLFGDLFLGYDVVIICGVSMVMIVLLNLLIKKTRLGLAMRAVSQNPDVSQTVGINLERTITLVFVIGSALAGIAGILNASYYGITKFDIGSNLGIKGFSAAVIGGLGDFNGAIVGGLILGFVETFSAVYIPDGSQYQNVFSFLAVIAFLIVRPRGVLGENVFEKV